MRSSSMTVAVDYLRRTLSLQDATDMTDGQLVEAFIASKDQAAFEALLRRHGPMVFSVCRRFIHDVQDAEDVFQATFLVFIRKAASVKPRDMVANWLHGVAYNIALKARAMIARRRVRECQLADIPEPEARVHQGSQDLRSIIDHELCHLPEKYRLPILLCDLEGRSIKEAMLQVGWPQGTLAGRLARARKMLASRLVRRGVAVSGSALAALLSENAVSACVSNSLLLTAAKIANLIGTGNAVTSMVSAGVIAFTEGALKSMMLTKLKIAALATLALAILVAFGSGLLTQPTAAAQQGEGQAATGKQPASLEESALPDEAKLHGEWVGKDDTGVNISMIFGPKNTVQLIAENGRNFKGTFAVNWRMNPYHLDLKWEWDRANTSGQTIIEFPKNGQLRIEDRNGEDGRPKGFTKDAILLTKRESSPGGSKQARSDATRDLEVAEFYRNTGHFGSAYFYYELIERRYPETDYAKKAAQALDDLKKRRIRLADGSEAWPTPGSGWVAVVESRNVALENGKGPTTIILENAKLVIEPKGKMKLVPVKTEKGNAVRLEIPGVTVEVPRLKIQSGKDTIEVSADAEGMLQVTKSSGARVGQIIVVGNNKTPTTEILKKVPIFPGELLDYPALRTAERNLAAFNATVTVIEIGDNAEFKDILISIKEK